MKIVIKVFLLILIISHSVQASKLKYRPQNKKELIMLVNNESIKIK
ncbi:hypothetical protein [Helicobacter sp. MIT 14-3879]|nr:hypothetical protein [Helicobacter sp. MIT 14-3879]